LGYNIQMIAPTSFFADTGCHVRILEEIETLQEAGHRVTVCTYHLGNEVEGVRIKRSLDVPWHKGVQVGSSRHKLYFDAVLALKAARVTLQEKPDIIHAHIHEGALIGFPLKWLLRGGRTPLIFDFQGSMTSEMVDHHFLRPDGPFYRPAVMVEKMINRMPDRIVTSSYNAARILQEQFKVADHRVVTISDRVNLRRFRPAETEQERAETAQLRQALGIPANRKVVVYLGLLAHYQGTEVLLETARLLKTEMPEAFFVIMGYPGVESYSKLAESMGLQNHVIFPGRIPYHEAPRYLRLGDVAVAPKMSATEGAGKIPNYMAMALPVITFDTPISHEFLGELGAYAEFGSARSLADHIKNLLTNDERRAYLGQAVRAKAVAHMGWERARYQLEALYEEVLAPKRRAPQIDLGVSADSGSDRSVQFEPNLTTSNSPELIWPRPVSDREKTS
jgi:glycosyltransferase involved in cell wall biosynthesis